MFSAPFQLDLAPPDAWYNNVAGTTISQHRNFMGRNMNRVALPFLLSALAMSFLTGCGETDKGPRTVPAEGVVTLDGSPIEGASIVFIDDGGQYPARGRSDADGKFSLSAFEYKTGAVPGSYKAIVSRTVVETASEKGPPAGSEEAEHAGEAAGQRVYNDLPPKYSQPGLLSFTVPEDGVTDLKIELTSK